MRKFLRACLFIAITMQVNVSSYAALIDVVGEYYSYDNATGLYWLDLSQTKGLSMANVKSGEGGWIPNGWRYANADETVSLFTSNIDIPFDNERHASTSETWDQLAYLMNTLGSGAVFHMSFGDQIYGLVDATDYYGFYDTSIRVDGLVGYSNGDVSLYHGFVLSETYSLPYLGSYLVRNTLPPELSPLPIENIPEPSVYYLVVTGFGLIFLTRRKKRSSTI